MPITPQQIKERRGEAVFEFGGESVHVEYMAALVEALTKDQVEQWQEQVNACETPEEANKLVADWLCQFVTKWDVYERQDESGAFVDMWPITPERVAELDQTFLARVMIEVVRDANQSKLGGAA